MGTVPHIRAALRAVSFGTLACETARSAAVNRYHVKVDAWRSSTVLVAQAGPVVQAGPVGSGTGLRCGVDILSAAAAPSPHANTAANGTEYADQRAIDRLASAIAVTGGLPDGHAGVKSDRHAVADGDRATAHAGADPR
jgi:hypothetical protein